MIRSLCQFFHLHLKDIFCLLVKVCHYYMYNCIIIELPMICVDSVIFIRINIKCSVSIFNYFQCINFLNMPFSKAIYLYSNSI